MWAGLSSGKNKLVDAQQLTEIAPKILHSKASEASLTDSCRESGSHDGRLNDQHDGVGDDVQVLVHKVVQTSSKACERSICRCDGSTKWAKLPLTSPES